MLLTEELNVFKKSHNVTLEIYKLTRDFPKEETYGLVSQMKRAAVSINSNLMEGGARNTEGERKYFIGIARGSASELMYQLQVSKDIGFLETDKADFLINELEQVAKMLTGMIKRY